ncbi:MAG TPA: SMC-Scp complex subunit ScpB [Chitinophaga sp.]|uniref:SMC-Scp complex subunit ScpB n=1 Tax=Chitinophaga sp. TaxID=1869181 RepID=UPI002C79412F|nr:SMC-Scp complex subunit ScpB [Chitinophaga sp.]HVI48127.1 SMC-Scp complex subunit ScpB [Chitinophaga sp.]
MEISQLIPHVEALIFAADRPLPVMDILDLLNNALAFLEDRATLDQVEAAIDAIREKYSSEFYAFEVRSSGGGYQFMTKKEYYQTVAQLNGDKFLKRLSTAALETLAIIAYRQPISKGEIEYIRGVSTDYSIQKLLEKELIVISGRSEDLPGKPLLYSVSRSFMDYFGINTTADLPKLRELFDEEMVQPTLIKDETAATGEEAASAHHSLMVSESGELLDPDHELDTIMQENAEELPASEDESVEPDDNSGANEESDNNVEEIEDSERSGEEDSNIENEVEENGEEDEDGGEEDEEEGGDDEDEEEDDEEDEEENDDEDGEDEENGVNERDDEEGENNRDDADDEEDGADDESDEDADEKDDDTTKS